MVRWMVSTNRRRGTDTAVQEFKGSGPDRLILPGSAGARLDVSTSDASERGSPPRSWSDVPWRTIVATVGVVVGTYAAINVIDAAIRVVAWILIAGFFAIVLAPLVRRVQDRVGGRRNVATGIVVFSTLAVMIGVVALFIIPVRTQLIDIITDLPGAVHDAADGKGPIGNLVSKLHIESYVQDNETELARVADRLDDSSFETVQTALGAVLGFITVTLLTFLFLSQAEAMGRGAIGLVSHRRRASAKRVAIDAAGAVSGYVIGNLLISLIAGSTSFVCLIALGVPSPIVLALFVAVADLVPLVGATIGAAVGVIAAYLHSPNAGLVALIFFVVYQQIENGVIYPWVMARKVNVNPLVVLLSVLVGVELVGVLGALLAVPMSGALQVIVKAVRQEHQREQLVLPEDVSEPVAL